MPIRHLDCFSGPGGFCTGMHAAGIQTVAAVEKVDSCVETYRANHPGVKVFAGDIRSVKAAGIGRIAGGVDIITSGMPCETFSTAGARSRSFYDARQQLFMEPIRLGRILRAPLILFENVPGILTKKVERGGKRRVIEDLYKCLEEAGYRNHATWVLDAVHYGVPQHRDRLFILASRRNIPLKPPAPLDCHVTVADALTGIPQVEANSGEYHGAYQRAQNSYTRLMKDNGFWRLPHPAAGCTYHTAPNHRAGTLERFKLIEQGEGLRDLFNKFTPAQREQLQAGRVLPKKWYIQRNRRLVADEPSHTVTSHCLDELVHPTLNRCLTVREAARLQSFPDNYDFRGGPVLCPHIFETQDKYEQIGDAVPPLMAFHWGSAIRQILGGDAVELPAYFLNSMQNARRHRIHRSANRTARNAGQR